MNHRSEETKLEQMARERDEAVLAHRAAQPGDDDANRFSEAVAKQGADDARVERAALEDRIKFYKLLNPGVTELPEHLRIPYRLMREDERAAARRWAGEQGNQS